MSRTTILSLLNLVLFLSSSTGQANEIAPWADPALPVQKGLVLWLDATRPESLLGNDGKVVKKSGDPIATWLDASPSTLRLEQKAAKSQPKLEIEKEFRSVRFGSEGESVYLQGKTSLMERELTLFLVAAPHRNVGGFRGLLSASQRDRNDYTSGFNVDLGPGGSQQFSMVNYEGGGAGGVKNLKPQATEFGKVHVLCLSTSTGDEGVHLRVNGADAGSRARTDGFISMETLILGGRYYRNDGPPEATGFLEGDIGEVLIFNQILDEDEIKKVEQYLITKHGNMRKVARPRFKNEIEPLSYVPAIQMFVPGFSVQEMPIALTNINNLKYRPDGKLLALAYSGNAYLLSDTDSDGIEDRAEIFWDNQGRIQNPIGMALTPSNYPQGTGFFTASKGKLSLVVDTDGDNVADHHEVLAEGWTQLAHGVDALGVAFDDGDGSVYFGLGTAAYTNGYLIDEQGKSQFDLMSERGTIMRVDTKTKHREIVCTGIRFPVAMAFNSHRDLFCTDQEGATWLPNGNPYDELLHIEPKRHYGFPPRHPKHLPNVVDEPNVCDYFPQHQSTCGLNFNEPVNGGPVFGPAAWRSDAFVCGYTRGKLYRTQLARTHQGYVSRNHLIASLDKLTCDACVSPQGELVVATHSGGPDWGSGPNGKGKLYKIRYEYPALPQPVAVWPETPHEVRVVFDRPLEPEHFKNIGAGISLTYGKHVAAGDRFEVLRPGYQVVVNQMNSPRELLEVFGVGITADRRTLVVSTAAHSQRVGYALTIPGLGRSVEASGKAVKQYAETDLGYTLGGVRLSWQSDDGVQSWSGWLPHLDLEVSKRFTSGSSTHQHLWEISQTSGKWKFETALDLQNMLRPVVQEGSKVDAVLPPERVTIALRSRVPHRVNSSAFRVEKQSVDNGMYVSLLVAPEDASQPLPLSVEFSASQDPGLVISYHTADDSRPRALQLARFVLPWGANLKTHAAEQAEPELPTALAGGNWSRGRRIFFGAEAACSKCHKYDGLGESIGPDLSNLPHRDFASVMRDIEQPNFAINPDHLSHNIVLSDGRILSGLVRVRGEQLFVTDNNAKTIEISSSDIEAMSPSEKSIMPEGLSKALGTERMRDLLTFLLTLPPRMPLDGPEPPPLRARKEVESVLSGSSINHSPKPLHVLLVAGKKDHGPGEHDYPAWQKVWAKLLALGENVEVSTAQEWPSAKDFNYADVIVFYQLGTWSSKRAAATDAFLARGGGLVYIHYAIAAGGEPAQMAERIGLAWDGGRSRFRHGPLKLDFRNPEHPITRNLSQVEFFDESYWRLTGNPSQVNLLASGIEDDAQQPLLWTAERGPGRIFVSVPGHFSWTFDDPLFRVLLLRGICWSAKEPVDRLNDLVFPGARMN